MGMLRGQAHDGYLLELDREWPRETARQENKEVEIYEGLIRHMPLACCYRCHEYAASKTRLHQPVHLCPRVASLVGTPNPKPGAVK